MAVCIMTPSRQGIDMVGSVQNLGSLRSNLLKWCSHARIERGLEEISTQLKCEFIPNVITVFGPRELGVFIRRFVEQCFRLRPRPTCVMRARIIGRLVPPFGREARVLFRGEDVVEG